jgi:predicted extracellular nuclease
MPAGPDNGLCQGPANPISQVQGDGYDSPVENSHQTVRGIVTYVKRGDGFYIEQSGAHSPSTSSKALFVSDQQLSESVEPGQQWALSGRVSELGRARDKLTSLTDLSSHQLCEQHVEVPQTRARLPLDSAQREALEGMRLSFSQPLVITDVYNLSRGEVTLSAAGVLQAPTEIKTPGRAAQKLKRSNRNHSLVAILPGSGISATPIGSSVGAMSGLLGHNGRAQQFFPDAVSVLNRPPEDPLEPREGAFVRVVDANLLNFFNGDGKGGGFPTERGAKSPAEFKAQSARLQAALQQMQPDLLAVQELENDGFGPLSAASSLLELLNSTGERDWAVVKPGSSRVGGDVITVGLFYRKQVLETIGPATVIAGRPFEGRSRHPLAQLFRDRNTGARLLVAVNHLKSKGRCPDSGANTDQDDGQGCWNAARLAAVKAQVPQLQQLAAEAQTNLVLVVGDMNAWRNEDPINRFRASGYLDLVEELSGLPQHSYLYWGQLGTLDYAFASPALLKRARRAKIWHINAGWPRHMEPPRPWLRASDHDPVIVDFDFSQSATSD